MSDTNSWVMNVEIGFVIYFILLSLFYTLLNGISVVSLMAYMSRVRSLVLPRSFQPLLPPVSVIVPAYNESATIVSSVKSMLQLDYPNLEVIVVNDGSSDDTLAMLHQAFNLDVFPEAYRKHIATKPIKQIYRARNIPHLKVVDKINGGKADALNVGINVSQSPLFCGVDADSVLQRDSLKRIIMPFLDSPETIAVGGSIRIANGCQVEEGLLRNTALPSSWLARIQIIEYLRAFLFGRNGWSPLNALLIISGAFGVFKRDAVVAAGGYLANSVGEDMELIVRLHKRYRLEQKEPYRISFVPDPVCWTEAPEDFRTLKNQRLRWQRGLLEALSAHTRLCFHPRGGTVSWFAYPFMLVFEGIGPLLEVSGYLFTLIMYLNGNLSGEAALVFLAAAVGLGMFVSVLALVMEEMTFRLYKKKRSVAILFLAAILENLGYRQLNSCWRLLGTWQWLRRKQHGWGTMKRKGNWQQPDSKN